MTDLASDADDDHEGDGDRGAEPDAPPAEGPWWGAGAAATQCEGAAPRSDWAGWEAEGRVPPSRDGNGFGTRYADDLALLAEHGLRRYRLTVEWARLQPQPDRWDADALAHVVGVLRAGQAAGVAVWVCLLHGSAPGWFTDDARGWLDDKAATLTWPRYVDRVAEEIGDLVAGWLPVHEPDLQARLGYLDGTFPPGRHHDDDHRDARRSLRRAEAEAARLLRGGGRPVAVTLRVADPHEDDDLIVVGSDLDRLPEALERASGAVPHTDLLVVTGDPDEGDDDQRTARLRRAATAVREAAASGIAVAGCFHLPAVDGYEWHRGFTPRLGLFDRDRNPKPALGAVTGAGR